MARLNIDTPQIQENELPDELNKWFSNMTDQANSMFGNIIADTTPDIGNHGAGPLAVAVPGMNVTSVVIASVVSSTNPVAIQTVTATSTGFNIVLTGDPGLHCYVSYIAFLSDWAAQGV